MGQIARTAAASLSETEEGPVGGADEINVGRYESDNIPLKVTSLPVTEMLRCRLLSSSFHCVGSCNGSSKESGPGDAWRTTWGWYRRGWGYDRASSSLSELLAGEGARRGSVAGLGRLPVSLSGSGTWPTILPTRTEFER